MVRQRCTLPAMNQNFITNTSNIRRIKLFLIFVLLFSISVLLIESCIPNNQDISSIDVTSEYKSQVMGVETINSTNTGPQTIINPTLSPSPILTSTSEESKLFYDLGRTIAITQGPIQVSTETPNTEEYLYKDTKVTVWLANEMESYAYLNLDDLTDNGMKNSDVVILMTSGNELYFDFYPINHSGYYYSGETTIDYDSCMKSFPINGMTLEDYKYQEFEFITGNPYCVITNEGYIAIVKYLKDTLTYNDDYSANLSVLVTVYSKKNQ